ncbi:hypothetical protein CUW27_20815 [Salmonella enterica]|nr:hypothetical protein [Salmonella enterica]
MSKPHIFRYVPDSPIHTSQDGANARFILVNDDGEFRAFWLANVERHRLAIEARLRGDTHYTSPTPCPDCDGVDYFAHPLTVNLKELFAGSKFARGECYHCKRHPESRSPERRATGDAFRHFAEVVTTARLVLEYVDAVATLRAATHYGRERGGYYTTASDRHAALTGI